ncbi:hypothetical protein N7468_002110 [Penicillium chermesinum]|uniref:Uncharacterized protein n=1 Tax=Penicillium chermesinum TaxID=63820 RepID=A0A9W9PJA3_9EURO|nr:uncharacterized protein N7468_002110 [Penicillium chermesinum]KAJ5247127.1 hypothetical protein N7468_002110 [Penicillium chermesinum]
MADEKKANPFEDLNTSEPPDQGLASGGQPDRDRDLNDSGHVTGAFANQPTSNLSQPYPGQQPGAYLPQQLNQYPSQPYPPQQGPYPSNQYPPIPDHKKPIVIPAIGPENVSPFLRAYAPILEKYKLPKDSFYRFLDELNEVKSTSPPLQVLDVTGGILQAVPILFPLRWIGSAVSGLASLGGYGVSKGRADLAIKKANKEVFGPRGLKVEIAKLDAIAHIAHIPILDQYGKMNRQAPLVRQLDELSQPASNEAQELYLQKRRIQVLQPWIAELDIDVLPWTPKSKLHRFNNVLKKKNNPEDSQRDRRRDERSRDSRDRREHEYRSEDGEPEFRRPLWLVIRETESAGSEGKRGN